MKIKRKEHTIVETDKGFIIRIDIFIFNFWIISSYVDDKEKGTVKIFKTFNQAKQYATNLRQNKNKNGSNKIYPNKRLPLRCLI